MKLLLRLLITTILVLIISHLMKGVRLDNGIETSLKVAVVLALLNFFVKPVLVLFTLPVTFFTLGLFLLVINTIIILLCSYFVKDFHIASFWTAMLFSIILSLSQSLVYQFTGETK
ncbi:MULTISPECIES: phage holin family protein [Flavobacterium]|uniref:Phage holin family protein n=1 Tax=Flavobacterium sedimenticola TaxID=3043286 RepID=A0ABT6XRT6_9FLAO|nr:phage holin family protein [Flavobacterium sedimenticola]MDI9257733.1 phage holin family protein [Flavobacterium sedimenticola]